MVKRVFSRDDPRHPRFAKLAKSQRMVVRANGHNGKRHNAAATAHLTTTKAKANGEAVNPRYDNLTGRPRGSTNRIPRDMMETFIEAARLVGSDDKGQDGLLGYCIAGAMDFRKEYLNILARIIPYKIKVDASLAPTQVLTIDTDKLQSLETDEVKVLRFLLAKLMGQIPAEEKVVDVDVSDYALMVQ